MKEAFILMVEGDLNFNHINSEYLIIEDFD
jgi:hypothetical protein